MTGSTIREKRQKKVQVELRSDYHGEKPQLVIDLTPLQVTCCWRSICLFRVVLCTASPHACWKQ